MTTPVSPSPEPVTMELQDWRIADNYGNAPENMPATLVGPTKVAVEAEGFGLGLTFTGPDGKETKLLIEIDGGAVKVVAFAPDPECTGSSHEEHVASMVVTEQGALVQPGHFAPGQRFARNMLVRQDGEVQPHEAWKPDDLWAAAAASPSP